MKQDAQTPNAAANAAGVFLNGCLATMAALSNVMTEETRLVKTQNVARLQELVAQKNRLVLDYRAQMKSIAQDPGLVKNAPREMRDRLLLEGTKLAEATGKNEKLLKTAVFATRLILKNIFGAIKEEALPVEGYGHLRQRRGHLPPNQMAPSVIISRSA
jgi:hypothetical protein